MLGLDDEHGRLPELKNIVAALMDFVIAIDPHVGGTNGWNLSPSGRWWVYSRNFVAFQIHNGKVIMSLNGKPFEFKQKWRLPLTTHRTAYSKAELTSPAQLDAATSYIRQSLCLTKLGRRRKRVRASVQAAEASIAIA